MTALPRGMVRCDFCGYGDRPSHVIHLDDPVLQDVCHQCLLEGHINYCPRCWLPKTEEQLNINGICWTCAEITP